MGEELEPTQAVELTGAQDTFTLGKIPASPLEKIALSLSGGGYRAASFHLGGMSYLNDLTYKGKPLLQNVEMISTVSGGTIPGVVYTLMNQEETPFVNIYRFLLGKLETIDLIATGIDKLNPDQQLKNKKKAKNLINSFAEQYDEHFTAGATLADLQQMKGHLKAVAFNATEFSSAINFRFRNPGPAYSGNNNFKLNRRVSSEIKLSDVLASSSCFPGGFEPLLWPNDYRHDKSPALDEIYEENEKLDKLPAGIMDGGIYDNQGIESILMYKDGLEKPYFDLIIISDVASPDMKAYEPLKETEKTDNWKSLTLKDILLKGKDISNYIYCGLGLIAAIGFALPFICNFNSEFYKGVCTTIAIISLLAIAAKWLAIRLVKRKLSNLGSLVKKKFPDFYYQQLSRLKIQELSVHRIEPLLFNRLNSLITLLGEVFLKIIRRLNYKRLYEQPNYEFRRSTVLIKELTEKDWTTKHPTQSYENEIGPNLKAITEQAANFGTTLWFTDKEKLDEMLIKLVITGQATMCYNIKVYLEELVAPPISNDKDNGFSALSSAVQEELKNTLETCKQDWEKFKTNPGYLHAQLK